MTRVKVAWSEISWYLTWNTDVYLGLDSTITWRRAVGSAHECLQAVGDGGTPASCQMTEQDYVWVDQPALLEPPDGTRIEFVHQTDVYAAWRDDDSSAEAGWSTGNGGQVWVVYPGSVPVTWLIMWLQFGDSLRTSRGLIDTGPIFRYQ